MKRNRNRDYGCGTRYYNGCRLKEVLDEVERMMDAGRTAELDRFLAARLVGERRFPRRSDGYRVAVAPRGFS